MQTSETINRRSAVVCRDPPIRGGRNEGNGAVSESIARTEVRRVRDLEVELARTQESLRGPMPKRVDDRVRTRTCSAMKSGGGAIQSKPHGS